MEQRLEKALLKMIKEAESGWDIVRILNKYEQTPAICEAALAYNPWFVCHLKNPTEEQFLNAIKFDGDVIYDVDNPTEQMWIEAIHSRNENRVLFSCDSEKIYLDAVEVNGNLLKYITQQSEAICREAVKTSPEAIQYVSDIYLRRRLEKEQKNSLDKQIKEANTKRSVSSVKIKSYTLEQR